MNFLIEIALHMAGQEEIPQESLCFGEEWHAKHPILTISYRLSIGMIVVHV
jgi:hypothetical protein